MTKFLYWVVELIAKMHSYILRINDAYEYQFTDKELHFIVIGLFGMFLVLVVYPVFRYLAKRGHYLTLSSIYAFTLVVVVTFAIEIGQKITHTGSMEFADVMFGVTGFLAMYFVFAFVVGIIKVILGLFKRKGTEKE